MHAAAICVESAPGGAWDSRPSLPIAFAPSRWSPTRLEAVLIRARG